MAIRNSIVTMAGVESLICLISHINSRSWPGKWMDGKTIYTIMVCLAYLKSLHEVHAVRHESGLACEHADSRTRLNWTTTSDTTPISCNHNPHSGI